MQVQVSPTSKPFLSLRHRTGLEEAQALALTTESSQVEWWRGRKGLFLLQVVGEAAQWTEQDFDDTSVTGLFKAIYYSIGCCAGCRYSCVPVLNVDISRRLSFESTNVCNVVHTTWSDIIMIRLDYTVMAWGYLI